MTKKGQLVTKEEQKRIILSQDFNTTYALPEAIETQHYFRLSSKWFHETNTMLFEKTLKRGNIKNLVKD